MNVVDLDVRDDELFTAAFSAVSTEAADALLAVTVLLSARRELVDDPDFFRQEELRIECGKVRDLLYWLRRRLEARLSGSEGVPTFTLPPVPVPMRPPHDYKGS